MMNYDIFKEVVKEKFMDYMPETVSYTHLREYQTESRGICRKERF